MTKVLFLINEIPGYYPELCLKIAKELNRYNISSIFACVAPHVLKSRGLNDSDFGEIYYFTDYEITINKSLSMQYSNWYFYSTFVRQSHFLGKHRNNYQDYQKLFYFFEKLLNDTSIKVVLSEGVSSSFLNIAYLLAKSKNVPYLGYMAARIPNKFNIHIDDVGNYLLSNTDNSTLKIDLPPDYMSNSNYGHIFNVGWKEFIMKIPRFLGSFNQRSHEIKNLTIYTLLVYMNFLKRYIFEKSLSLRRKLFLKYIAFDSDKVFILYPIHFRPEASTSVAAKYYECDYEILKNISFSMLPNMVLVVKEHKVNIGNNKINFYKKIKQLPNTILLSPYYNLKENIHNFSAVITLTSTVGFEALQKNVKVGVLGEVFYQNYPGATKLNSYTELENYVQSLAVTKPNCTQNAEIDSLYAKLCFEGSFNYMNIRCLDTNNVSQLARPLIEFLSNRLETFNATTGTWKQK